MNNIFFLNNDRDCIINFFFHNRKERIILDVSVNLPPFLISYTQEVSFEEIKRFQHFFLTEHCFTEEKECLYLGDNIPSIIIKYDIYGHINYTFKIDVDYLGIHANIKFITDRTFLENLLMAIRNIHLAAMEENPCDIISSKNILEIRCSDRIAYMSLKTSNLVVNEKIRLIPELEESTKLLYDYKDFCTKEIDIISLSSLDSFIDIKINKQDVGFHVKGYIADDRFPQSSINIDLPLDEFIITPTSVH